MCIKVLICTFVFTHSLKSIGLSGRMTYMLKRLLKTSVLISLLNIFVHIMNICCFRLKVFKNFLKLMAQVI